MDKLRRSVNVSTWTEGARPRVQDGRQSVPRHGEFVTIAIIIMPSVI